RIGGRNNSSDQTNRLGNLLNAVSGILLNESAGLGVFICIVNILGSVVVLNNLVLNYTHAGLLFSHLCQRNSCLVCCHGSGKKDFVYLFLCVSSKNFLCLAHLFHARLECFYVVNDCGLRCIGLSCHLLSSSC